MDTPNFRSGVEAVGGPQNFRALIYMILDVIYLLIPLVASLALLAFLWGLVKFISKAGDEKAIKEGKSLMIWGLVALFMMISVWGIISFFSGELGFGPSIALPLLPE